MPDSIKSKRDFSAISIDEAPSVFPGAHSPQAVIPSLINSTNKLTDLSCTPLLI